METLDEIKEKFKELSHDQLIELVSKMQLKIDTLEHMLFAKRSEKRPYEPAGTPLLFNDPEVAAVEALDDETSEVKGHARKKRGKRKPLPQNLPRRRVIHDLPADRKVCPIHNQALVKIGERTSEKLEVIPARVEIIEEVTLAYKCPCCSSEAEQNPIVTSQPEPALLPKSFATPSLLAYIVTAKYQDALPLYRQEKIFQRYGIDLDRTTMARWMIQVGQAAQALINLMYDDLLERRVIGCDETPVQVLKENNRQASQKSHMWVTISMIGPPIILFQYHTSRGAKVLESFLTDYQGTIVCDGLSSYDSFAANKEGVTLAACMTHIRRKFYLADKALRKAAPKLEPKTAEGLNMIRDLYRVEKELQALPPEEKLEKRQSCSKPLMERFKSWMDDQQNKCLPKSLLGRAISYANKQWEKMEVFLSNPLVPIDNNPTEAAIRPFVIGRNNWIFADTPKGADASANLYSLVESARANGLQPYHYLTLVFKELPKAQHDLDLLSRLLPHNVIKYYEIESYKHPD